MAVVLAFTFSQYEPRRSTAEVEQMQGLYIFTDSRPVMEYEYLGTVKTVLTWDPQYQGVRNKFIKKARKKFPKADGLILHFKSGGFDRCDVIGFK
jgi:hypothetical protein